jgi:hypothetical protein
MGPGGDSVASPRLPLLAALAAVGIGSLAAAAWWYLRRRRAASVPAQLRRAADDVIESVLIPNVEGGQIHIEYAVLTRQGIVVLNLRDAAGHVFGSETMQEWTVLARSRRFTFANPLPALYDRLAAVKRLLPEVPVRGVVVFTPGADFSKGFPPNVAMLDSLIAEIVAERESRDGPPAELLAEAWARLRREAVSVGP